MKRHSLRRTLLMLLTLLIAGAIVNVAVAWTCVYWPPRFHNWPTQNDAYLKHGDGFSDWFVEVGSTSGWAQVHSHWQCGESTFGGIDLGNEPNDVLPSWAQYAYPERYPQGSLVFRVIDARGWPALSMQSSYESVISPNNASTQGKVESGIFLWSAQDSGRLSTGDKTFQRWLGALKIFPVAPIWPGFAINTVFYAGMLWLLFLAPFALRRRRRIQRGLCPKCAYDLRGRAPQSQVCPECGAAWDPDASHSPRPSIA